MAIQILLYIMVIYLLLGLVFAIAFVLIGATVIDDTARGSSAGFKIIILPGSILLWPVLLKKWIAKRSVDHDKTA